VTGGCVPPNRAVLAWSDWYDAVGTLDDAISRAGEQDRRTRTAAMVRLGGMIAIAVAILPAVIKL
jgi:hypothetical protein